MRGLGFFFGGCKRNEPLILENPRPIADHGMSSIESGNAGLDGYTMLVKADPDAPGAMAPVNPSTRPPYWRGGSSFEQ